MSSPFETAPTNNKTIRAHRLSVSRLMCNHFHWKCLITSLLISICVAHVAYCQLKGWQNDGNRTTSTHLSSSAHSSASNLCSNGYISVISVVLGATFYFIYLSECWHHYAQLGLLPRYSIGQVLELVETMRDAIPVVWWKSVCYHYVRRSRRVMRHKFGQFK
uniref:Transmembrane protein n=1 Tax=Globodera pallida TaxID=36090 RepID=A0A183C1G8_GLOPA